MFYEFIKESRAFSASILCEDTPLTFIGRFGFKSGRDTDKLAGVTYRIGETGSPVVTRTRSHPEVKVSKEVDMERTILMGATAADASATVHEPRLPPSVKRGPPPRRP
jgi:flavin reductase (DIM6/NTAB) family NADH-FMN oxidoreductase RutF